MTDQEANNRRTLKLMDEGKFSEAESRLAVHVAGTSDARFHSSYGICLQKLGRWSEAIHQFEAALALKPAYCEADWRNMLARSYLQDGHEHRAIEQWRIVSVMDPTYPSHDFPIDEARRLLEKHAQ
jgi:Flp pilus assembly protein TadD